MREMFSIRLSEAKENRKIALSLSPQAQHDLYVIRWISCEPRVIFAALPVILAFLTFNATLIRKSVGELILSNYLKVSRELEPRASYKGDSY